MKKVHKTHTTQWRDSSHYEEICIHCGRTDTNWDNGELVKPCPEKDKTKKEWA